MPYRTGHCWLQETKRSYTLCKERQRQRNHECDFPLVRSVKKCQQNNAVDTEYDRYGKEYTYLLAPFRAKRTKCHAIPGKTDG